MIWSISASCQDATMRSGKKKHCIVTFAAKAAVHASPVPGCSGQLSLEKISSNAGAPMQSLGMEWNGMEWNSGKNCLHQSFQEKMLPNSLLTDRHTRSGARSVSGIRPQRERLEKK